MNRRRSLVLAALAAGTALLTLLPSTRASSADAKYEVVRQYDVRVPMRDGVELSADVYRPDAPGKFPVILMRTPYDNGTPGNIKRGKFWASRGFVYVLQDVRGKGESDGVFDPLFHETEDGYDAQTWCGTQAWSSGKVGTTGGSYLGWTQLFPAHLNNPHLAVMMPLVAPPDPWKNIPYQDGAVQLSMAAWMANVSGRGQQDITEHDVAAIWKTLPLVDIGSKFGWEFKTWKTWLDHPAVDDYWRARSYQDRLVETKVPALHVSGWYDDDLVGTLGNFTALSTRAKDPATRSLQRLLVGPWGHSVNRFTKLGDIDFGPTARIDLDALQVRWFSRWLLGEENGIDKEPPVRIFVMGTNVWRDENEWPIARTKYVKYYLRSGGRANSRLGDGVLSPEAPREEKPDRFRYDPADPVPFLMDPDYQQVGSTEDYRAVERRDDVLVYSTPPMTEEMEVCGPLKVRLWAATSGKDTDWTAKVLDVHPDGYAQRLNDGIIRARYRKGLDRPEPVEPGKPEEYEIDCWATCVNLAKGHSLRLEISSSAFPKFDRNLNTGGPIGKEDKWIVADQTIYHDAKRASYLLVPVVPKAKVPETLPAPKSGGSEAKK